MNARLFAPRILALSLVGSWLLAPPLDRAACRAADAAPLVNAHAHNDYAHKRPLADALDHGFCSVEADIFLVDGALIGRALQLRREAGTNARGIVSRSTAGPRPR